MPAKRQFKSRKLSFERLELESMDQYITITSEDQNPCDFISNFVESVNIADGYEVAVKSIFHAPLYNITEVNNKFALTTIRSGKDAISIFEIPVGFYESTVDVMAAIHKVLSDAVEPAEDTGDDDTVRPDPLITVAPTYKINNGIISLKIADNPTKSPARKVYFLIHQALLGNTQVLRKVGYVTRGIMKLENIVVSEFTMTNSCESGFLYSSIVTNSMINQKQSRLLACLPINSSSGYNYHEVQNPVYQPLSVHSFTDINFALTDVHGEIMRMAPYLTLFGGYKKTDMPTILMLHIRKIR